MAGSGPAHIRDGPSSTEVERQLSGQCFPNLSCCGFGKGAVAIAQRAREMIFGSGAASGADNQPQQGYAGIDYSRVTDVACEAASWATSFGWGASLVNYFTKRTGKETTNPEGSHNQQPTDSSDLVDTIRTGIDTLKAGFVNLVSWLQTEGESKADSPSNYRDDREFIKEARQRLSVLSDQLKQAEAGFQQLDSANLEQEVKDSVSKDWQELQQASDEIKLAVKELVDEFLKQHQELRKAAQSHHAPDKMLKDMDQSAACSANNMEGCSDQFARVVDQANRRFLAGEIDREEYCENLSKALKDTESGIKKEGKEYHDAVEAQARHYGMPDAFIKEIQYYRDQYQNSLDLNFQHLYAEADVVYSIADRADDALKTSWTPRSTGVFQQSGYSMSDLSFYGELKQLLDSLRCKLLDVEQEVVREAEKVSPLSVDIRAEFLKQDAERAKPIPNPLDERRVAREATQAEEVRLALKIQGRGTVISDLHGQVSQHDRLAATTSPQLVRKPAEVRGRPVQSDLKGEIAAYDKIDNLASRTSDG